MTPDLRAKDYDPVEREREREAAERLALRDRLASIENRLQRLERTQARRYANLRGFRTRAIRAIYALNKLTLSEMGIAFGITKQRIAQIVHRKAT